MKFAITYWDAEGGLSHGKAEKLVESRVPSLKRAISKRLSAKIPPLPKMRKTEHLVVPGGDAKKCGGGIITRSELKKYGKSHHDRRVGSSDHPGQHKGDMRHYVGGQGGNNKGGVGKGKK
jgi:hypothetical protein